MSQINAGLSKSHWFPAAVGGKSAPGSQKYGAPWCSDGEEAASNAIQMESTVQHTSNLPCVAMGSADVSDQGWGPRDGRKFYSCLLSRQTKKQGKSNKLSPRMRNLMAEMAKRGMGFGDNRCRGAADVNPCGRVWPFTPWGSSPLFPADSRISGNEKDKEQTSRSCDSPKH